MTSVYQVVIIEMERVTQKLNVTKEMEYIWVSKYELHFMYTQGRRNCGCRGSPGYP